ncbi:MAG: methylated-DNA--[protein]-cysteine S-methyltransferase [Rikenellaceae bacterium]
METKFATYKSPIGYLLIGHRGEGRLTHLQILEHEPQAVGAKDPFTDMVYGQVMEYLRAERTTFDVELDISGCTPFQREVYRALLEIPYGTTASYKEVATQMGTPHKSRAVGMANGRNPIHIIIPCHRVIASDGNLSGYAAGVEVKRFLIDLEALFSG